MSNLTFSASINAENFPPFCLMIEVFSCCCVISIEIFSISTSKILVGLFGTDDNLKAILVSGISFA